MRIERVILRVIGLELREPFRISSGVTRERRILLVHLEGDGVVGVGECVAGESPHYSYETLETARFVLEHHLGPAVLGAELEGPGDAAALMDHAGIANAAVVGLSVGDTVQIVRETREGRMQEIEVKLFHKRYKWETRAVKLDGNQTVDVTLERDVVIEPNTLLRGATRVATGATVGPNCQLVDTEAVKKDIDNLEHALAVHDLPPKVMHSPRSKAARWRTCGAPEPA